MGLYSSHLRPRLHALALNTRITGEVRDRVCSGLAGDVLEIGYGSGLNQPHLPSTVRGVWAVEPSHDGPASERAAAVGVAGARDGRRGRCAGPAVP